ncbi:hypothetical protein JW935_19060, partial [candidate division KSB1 bacterium]|nr:hypothetical protein [candidate division KSB1 bacterium]
DVLGNWNGQSSAPIPPPLPAFSNGLIITITDGIFPIITDVMTVDANYATEQASGGASGWGYLDYVDVTFDHQMNTARPSTAGFNITGRGIASIAGAGVWINNTTMRIPLVATVPKKANTGVIPYVTYANAGDPFGMEATNGGDAEDLLLSDTYTSGNNGLAVAIIDGAGPAVIYAITAGYRRIRVAFSEFVNTSGWPSNVGNSTIPNRFKWFVGTVISDQNTTKIYFTGLSPTRRDSVVYLNHTGFQWAKTDSGGINFFMPGLVLDANNVPNDQWDNDNTLLGLALSGSDVRIHADNIPPILLALQTQDFNLNGKIDHYRCVFDDLSPIFPIKSFHPANWTITGYDGPKQNLMVDLNVYNPLHANYRPGAINAFGDTVEAYIQYNETTGNGPEETPHGGDTGDVPDVNVNTANGFADWADNVMAALPNGLSIEMDRAGPAIMRAETITTTDVLAYISELVMSSSIAPGDFFLDMGGYGVGWLILKTAQINPGIVKITAQDQTYWLPEQTGVLSFSGQNVVTDDITGPDNGNLQVGLIPVNDHAASQFDVNLAIPGNVIRGVPFQFEVIARDSRGNVDTNFPEAVYISSNLTQNEIDLPNGAQNLEDGIGYFHATCWIKTENLKLIVSVNSDRYARYRGESAPFVVVDEQVDGPDTLIVRDYLGADGEGDQGGYVELVFDYSDNHPGFGADRSIDYYQIYREVKGEVFHWGSTIEATDTTGTHADSLRLVVWTGDNIQSRFWVRAVWDPQWPGAHGMNPTQNTQHLAPPSDANLQYVHAPVLIRSQGHTIVNKSAGIQTEGTNDQITSGSAMGIGRAVDNVAPLAPANLKALKDGVAAKLNWDPVTKGTNGTPELFDVKYAVYSHPTNAYFNPAVEGTLVATTHENIFTLNDGLLKGFYCVKALDSDNQSSLSNRVGKYGYQIITSEKPVYNYLSVPLVHSVIKNAKSLAQDLGNGFDALYKLDPATGGYSIYYLPSLNFGTNFNLPTGSPVMVSAGKNAPDSWFYTGDVPAQKSVWFTLFRSGSKNIYNEISLPLDRTDITNADQLAKDIGGVEVVLKLDPENGGFSKFWLPAIHYGENFKILPGEPVLISVNESAPEVWPIYAPMQSGNIGSNEDSE